MQHAIITYLAYQLLIEEHKTVWSRGNRCRMASIRSHLVGVTGFNFEARLHPPYLASICHIEVPCEKFRLNSEARVHVSIFTSMHWLSERLESNFASHFHLNLSAPDLKYFSINFFNSNIEVIGIFGFPLNPIKFCELFEPSDSIILWNPRFNFLLT